MEEVRAINSKKYKCRLFVRNDGSLIYFPTFFSHAMSNRGGVWIQKSISLSFGKSDFVYDNQDMSEVSQAIINNRLQQFLNWVATLDEKNKKNNDSHRFLDTHHNLDATILQYYLNEILIGERKAGIHSVDQTLMALRYYYSYIAKSGFTAFCVEDLYIKPKYKMEATKNTNKRQAVLYLSPSLRQAIYENTDTLRDRLLLETGGEIGLRRKENLGFLVNDFHVSSSKFNGLKSLFLQMRNNPNQQEFEYRLQGKYSKGVRNGSGGKSRTLYIHRSLLARFEKYYDLERPNSSSNTFFLNTLGINRGKPISKSKPSDVFLKAKRKTMKLQREGKYKDNMQLLHKDHTHHTLRHSFGTDKFYSIAHENGVKVDDVTPTSLVYLAVARLMGHSVSDRSAPRSTATYIRSCHIKDAFSDG